MTRWGEVIDNLLADLETETPLPAAWSKQHQMLGLPAH
jgi:hypothetical protein